MAASQMNEVMHHLRRLAILQNLDELTDAELLGNYLNSRNEAALTALVQRHGALVWGVCRRVLRNEHDAEDAFQATFLVFVRKVASITSRELLANWLYGVAQMTAMKARANAAKRRTREQQVTPLPEPASAESQQLWEDLQPHLDTELSRLPDRYRAVIVLCDLEGKTRKEAARHFGWPEGTVAGRLARARTLLAKRLARHAGALSSGSLAMVVARHTALGAVPPTLETNTIQAAGLFATGQVAAGTISTNVAVLTEGVLKMMMLSKLKIATAILLAVAVLGVGLASFRQEALAQQPKDKAVETKPKDKADDKTPKKDEPKKDEPKKDLGEQGISGTVTAVDAAKSTITITSKGTGEKTFTVQKDATVEIAGKPAKLTDVKAGTNVTLFMTEILQSVQVAKPPVKKDPEKKPVDPVKKPTDKPADPVKKPTDKPADPVKKPTDKPADPEKKPVDPAKKPVDPKPADPEKKPVGPPTFSGEVVTVDATKNTLTVKVKARDMVYTLAGDAKVELDGKAGKLADVPVGSTVYMQLTQVVRSIRVAPPQEPTKDKK